MGNFILHKDGAYNFYNTISDAPDYESALTLEQLKLVIKTKHGENGLRGLEERLNRAHRTGCSNLNGESLEDAIICNRAGKNEETMEYDEFVNKYLTLVPNIYLVT